MPPIEVPTCAVFGTSSASPLNGVAARLAANEDQDGCKAACEGITGCKSFGYRHMWEAQPDCQLFDRRVDEYLTEGNQESEEDFQYFDVQCTW